MISLVIDTNIAFSAFYNKRGLERTLLRIITRDKNVELFAPDVFMEELTRNLKLKLNFSDLLINKHLHDIEITEIPFEAYEKMIPRARELIFHENDIPFIAVALLKQCPIWSGNERHFSIFEKSEEIIWFNSRSLWKHLKQSEII